jgi:GNAT superfamily N-acetyltransferase
MSPEPRRATPDDHTALLPLIRRFYEIDHHPFDEAVVNTALAPLLEHDTYGHVWVLDDGAALVGYAVLTWGWSLESGGRDALIDEIYVDQRSHGHGAVLLAAVVDAAVQAGARVMFLETERHNSDARAFYLRHGFDVEDSIWMVRDLTESGSP